MQQMTSMMTEQTVDYLREDVPIPSQKFACVSFVEPTDQELVTDQEAFIATKFLTSFLADHKVATEFVATEGEDKVTDQIREHLDLSYDNVKSSFYQFRKLHLQQLQSDFEAVDITREGNTMRGLKVRGTFPSHSMAQQKAKELRQFEPAFDVFVTQVGFWVPFNPQNLADVDAEYDEDALNNLVKSKVEEDEKRQLAYEHRKMEMMAAAAKETEDLKAFNALEREADIEVITEEDDEDIFEILESDDDEELETLTVEDVVSPTITQSEGRPVKKVSKKSSRQQARRRKQTNRRSVNRRS